MPTFHINYGTNAGNKEILTSSRIIIGRSPDCGLILPDDGIDPAHASIEARADKWVIQDLGTPGGTWLNEQLVARPLYLSSGDTIRLNNVRIAFECTDEDTRNIRPVAIKKQPSPAQINTANKPGSLLYVTVGLGSMVIFITSLLILLFGM